MATKAPRPGVGKRAEAADDATRIVTIRFRDQEYKLAIGLVSIREKLLFLKETGFSFEELSFREAIYVESIAPLVWLARRAAGEPGLSFDAALKDWPNDMGIGEIALTVAAPDAGDTDPEA